MFKFIMFSDAEMSRALTRKIDCLGRLINAVISGVRSGISAVISGISAGYKWYMCSYKRIYMT